MVQEDSVPVAAQKLAWALSLAGIIPFAGLTALLFLLPDATQRSYAALALATYGAVILSFLGGMRWGAVLNGSGAFAPTFALSMVPPLAGWFALALPLPLPFIVHGVCFVLVAAWDWRAGRQGALEPWFVRLRTTISAIVVSLLILAATATLYGTP